MTTFDRVLPELLRICEQHPLHNDIARYCVVRDVRGRVRLILQPRGKDGVESAALQNSLSSALGGYFVPPLMSTDGKEEVGRLARQLFQHANGKWPARWPNVVADLLGNEHPIGAELWSGIERTIGKEAWLAADNKPPAWPLVRGKVPPIITFHSFKGGVGRTTLLAAYAVHLAKRGKRVAVVDLDLEAPGLGHVFGVNDVKRGVLDVLVDHIATGDIRIEDAHGQAMMGASVPGSIDVFPAGSVDEYYLPKLARLDFSSVVPDADNPVGTALTSMLKRLKKDYEVILLDSRAGLHDIAGISLHGLAHVDVLVFRGTNQGFAGLRQTLQTLDMNGKRSLVLVETLLPVEEETFRSRHERTRQKAYDLLTEHYYPDEDPPQQSDVDEPHDVLPIRRKEWLDALDEIQGQVVPLLADAELIKVSRRIDDACELSGDENVGVDEEGAVE